MNPDGSVYDQTRFYNGNGLTGFEDGVNFCTSIDTIDWNGDAIPDLVIGASATSSSIELGEFHIITLDSTDPTDIIISNQYEISDQQQGFPSDIVGTSQFGSGITSPGDIDGDGVSDIMVGAGVHNSYTGKIYTFFMNADGTIKNSNAISKATNDTSGLPSNLASYSASVIGTQLDTLPDLDGDGINEVLMGAGEIIFIVYLNNDGTVRHWEPMNALLGTNGAPNIGSFTRFGYNIGTLVDHDLENDGTFEILVGAPRDDDGGTDRGAVYILDIAPNNYSPSGAYSTPITPPSGTVQAYKKFIVDHDVPDGTDIKYSIGYLSGGICDMAAYGLLQISAPDGWIDISSIPSTETQLCIVANLSTTDPAITPSITSFTTTYTSDTARTFTFDVAVIDEEILSQQVINNIVIATTTPETDSTNNDDDHEHTVEVADVSIIKSVDKGSITVTDIQAGGTDSQLIYTLVYENH